MAIKNNKVLLVILDGVGISSQREGNAILNANLPFFYDLIKQYPCATLSAASEAVGLTEGEFGNSEVGHLNIGAGRVVWQDLAKISRSINDGSFFKKLNLIKIYEKVSKNNNFLHLVGLVSDGGIHSHIDHLLALLDLAKQKNLSKVFVHMITDGRDTPPQNAEIFIKKLENKFNEIGIGKIADISGRYYAMDRDKRWDRTQKAYNAIVKGVGRKAQSPEEAIKVAYSKNETDEFISPTVIVDDKNQPLTKIENNDGVLFFNFRADRMRQLTAEFIKSKLKIDIVTMTNYDKKQKWPINVLFPKKELQNTLSEVISNNRLSQLHIAETEKYAHVTYFFNGGREKPFSGEDRILVPSPKVSTYDLKPEMSADEITQKLIANLNKYDFIVVNFANPDMVGHTGNMEATRKAIEVIDKNLGEIIEKTNEQKIIAIICADHGNAEQMINPVTSEIDTEHTTNQVPFIIIDGGRKFKNLHPGKLSNVAPTILDIMGIKKPENMTEKSLFEI